MIKKYLFLAILSAAFSNLCFTQDVENYKEINEIWTKFCTAFDSLDYELMAEIHSKDLIRIPNGRQIVDYTNYIEQYKKDFESARQNNSSRAICLRFSERINNDSVASEKGVYKFIIDKGKDSEMTFYGKFHVLLTRGNGKWKILMDYDSNEDGTIGEDDFLTNHEMKDFQSFVRE